MYKKGGIYRKMVQKGGGGHEPAVPPLNPPLVLDGFTNELPTFMLVTSSFDVCWGVPRLLS